MILLLLLGMVFSSQAKAQVFLGPVSSALGGSGRAGLNANEGAFLNPALTALVTTEAAGYYEDGSPAAGQHLTAYGGSISENSPEVLMAGSLAYLHLRSFGLTATPVNGDLWHTSIAKLFFKRLAVGLSVVNIRQSPEGDSATDQWNGSIGGLFLILHDFGVSYVFDNPVNASSRVPLALRLMQQQSVGVFYSTPYYARLRLDLLYQDQYNPDRRLNVRGSIESEFADYFLFRLGARWDEEQDQRFITAGLGFNGPMIKVDYAFEKGIEGAGGAVHSVDLRGSF